jgi:hypothetical protein
MSYQTSADTAPATQILVREILNEINLPVPVDLAARNEAIYIADAIRALE